MNTVLVASPFVNGQTYKIFDNNENFKFLNRYSSFRDRIKSLLEKSTSENNDDDNPWGLENEGDHFPCGYELWWIYAVLELEDGRFWDVAMCFEYWMNKTRNGYEGGLSFYRIQHFDRENKKSYDNLHPDTFPGPLKLNKNRLDLTYYNNVMSGIFPDYFFHCEDDVNNVVFDINCHATSEPHWVCTEGTDGNLPWGFSGTFKYGIIPSLDVEGTIVINDELYNVTGLGYFEHEFGYIDLLDSFKPPSIKVFRETLQLYFSAARWWLKELRDNKIELYTFYSASNDNLFGWDWIWAAFDNGWSMTYFKITAFGNVEGLTTGVIHFTKDGKKYYEIGSIYTKYKEVVYDEKADMYIPLQLELIAHEGDMKLHLFFDTTTDMTKGYAEDKLCCYVYAGEVYGYYEDSEGNITINGFCSINPARVMRRAAHYSIDVDLIAPPKGLGISMRQRIHALGIEKFFKIQLRPKFEFSYYIKPVSES